MRSALLTAAPALAIILAGGLFVGLQVDRWKPSGDLQSIIDRVPQVPTTIGPWVGETVPAEDPGVFDRSGVRAYWQRRYVHRGDGSSVQVLMVAGKPGPISVHTPDVCFHGAGYSSVGSPKRSTIAPGDEAWSCRFVPTESSMPRPMEVYWAWSADGIWSAPDVPRVHFARKPALLKMYVLRDVIGPEKANPAQAFLAAALPEINRVVFVKSTD